MFKKVDGKIIFDGEVKELPKVEIVEGKKLEDTSFIVSKDDVIDALKLVFDPEINIDVYNLGLILTPLLFELQQNSKALQHILQKGNGILDDFRDSPSGFLFDSTKVKLGPRE